MGKSDPVFQSSAVIEPDHRPSVGFVLGDPTQIDMPRPARKLKPSVRMDAQPGEAAARVAPVTEPIVDVATPALPTLAIPPEAAPAPASAYEVAQASSLGVPAQAPVDAQVVSANDDLLARRDEVAETEFDDTTELELDSAFFSPQRILRQRGVLLLLAAGISLVGLFVFTEVVSVLNQIRNLPILLEPFAYAIVVGLTAIVVAAGARVVWLYARLKQSPRVSMAALGTLRERAVVRKQALDGLTLAQDSLQQFLLRYPIENKKDIARLTRLGVSAQEIAKLAAARTSLLESPRGSSVGWMDQVNRQFVTHLDVAAQRRIRLYTKMVGFKTAAVPNGFLDTLIVLINAYLLVGDLCVIYNVRAGGWGTASIMGHIFVNAFAAGKLDEWSSAAADQTAQSLTHHGTNLMANAVKGVTKVAARAADGYINALLISRLGNATVYHLRPLLEPAA